MLQEIAKHLNSGEINLPTFPNISIELDRLIQSDASFEKIAALLKKDMMVSAKLISVANSPRYGGLRQSTTVDQAISVLGLSTSKEFVDIIANRALYVVSNPKYRTELKELWQHGVACAHASRLVAELAKLANPGEVFFMGLMHDIGKLILLQLISELQTQNVIDPAAPKDLLDGFFLQHTGVFGRKLLEVWKLPSAFALVAQYNEAIEKAPTVSQELLAVHLGNLLTKRAGYGTYNVERDDTFVMRSAKSLGLDMANVMVVDEKLSAFMEETGLSFD
jgi:HD-like signal output (HDOD) protein